MEIMVVCGDMTEADVDAIVHPANSYMTMGGGLAAAILNKAGEDVRTEAKKSAPVAIGEAIVTKAGNLKQKFVIHAPTMVEGSTPTTVENAHKALLAILRVAEENNIKSLAVSGLGTGVGKVPRDKCAEMMVKTLRNHKGNLQRVLLMDTGKSMCDEFEKALQ